MMPAITPFQCTIDEGAARRFPASRYEAGSAGANVAAPAAITVLLVEDNPTDIFVIKKILAESDYRLNVLVARDGAEALNFVRKGGPQASDGCPGLVLLDLNLPKITGIEVLRQLRKSSACKSVPVVIVTSSDAETDRKAAQALGADRYFKKPDSVAGYRELGLLIKDVLESAQATSGGAKQEKNTPAPAAARDSAVRDFQDGEEPGEA